MFKSGVFDIKPTFNDYTVSSPMSKYAQIFHFLGWRNVGRPLTGDMSPLPLPLEPPLFRGSGTR